MPPRSDFERDLARLASIIVLVSEMSESSEIGESATFKCLPGGGVHNFECIAGVRGK